MADPGFHGLVGEEGRRATVRGANSRSGGDTYYLAYLLAKTA